MATFQEQLLFEISGQANSPSKDFYQLIITKTEVIWRWWKISVRIRLQSLKPGEMKQSHEEFLMDDRIQRQIAAIFGPEYLECIIGICEGNLDYLERMPSKMQEVCQLCQVTHDPKQPCDSELSWEQAVRRSGMEITPETERLAKNIGWEKIYNTFIHNTGQDDSETNVDKETGS